MMMEIGWEGKAPSGLLSVIVVHTFNYFQELNCKLK